MTTYVIGYDLHKPHRDYPTLWDAIKAQGSWWHCLDSTWMIASHKTAAQIRDDLRRHIDANDTLLVAQCGGGWATAGPFAQNCTDWLRDNL